MTRIDEIKARLSAATPGPWRWRGYLNQGIELRGGRFGDVVLAPERSGFHWTSFRVNVGGLLESIRKFAVREVPYRDDVIDVIHPDAELIANAPVDIEFLLGQLDAIEEAMVITRLALREECADMSTADLVKASLDELRGEVRKGWDYAGVMANQSNRVRRADGEPLPTVTTGTTTGLLTSYYRRDHASRPTDEPMATVSSEPRHGLVTAYYSGSDGNRSTEEPLSTVTAVARHGLVEGETIHIEDCSFRMLMPPEIGRGMAFRDDYRVGGTQRERVQQYGQAVTPPVATWIWQRVMESLR